MSSPIALPDPFGLTADPDGYVPRPATEEALAALVKTLREGQRPAALLGPPGLGKTLLLHLASKRLDDWLRSVYLPYAALPLDELCAWALSLLGFSQSSDTISDLLRTASELRSRGSGLLLLIDDAGAMPLPTARKLGDLIALSSGGLRMLAAAAEGPSASRMLAATGANVQLVRLLEPMNEEETREYVAARLARARIPASVAARFDAATLRRIHRLSAGIPRRVHSVASSVLRGGVGESLDDEEIAQAAVAELAPVPDTAASAEEELSGRAGARAAALGVGAAGGGPCRESSERACGLRNGAPLRRARPRGVGGALPARAAARVGRPRPSSRPPRPRRRPRPSRRPKGRCRRLPRHSRRLRLSPTSHPRSRRRHPRPF